MEIGAGQGIAAVVCGCESLGAGFSGFLLTDFGGRGRLVFVGFGLAEGLAGVDAADGCGEYGADNIGWVSHGVPVVLAHRAGRLRCPRVSAETLTSTLFVYEDIGLMIVHKKSSKLLLPVALILLSTILCSCGCRTVGGLITKYSRDVTSKTELWGGYSRDGVYLLQRDVFIFEKDFWPKGLALTSPPWTATGERLGMWEYSAPESVADYHQNKSEWPFILGIVRAGTEIRVHELREQGSAAWPSTLTPYGVILDGDFQGSRVELYDMSKKIRDTKDPSLLRPDSQLLELKEGY